jgi:hypothetical protein
VRCSKIPGLGSTSVPTSAINISTEIATAEMDRPPKWACPQTSQNQQDLNLEF